MDTPLKESSDGKVMTIADTLEADDYFEDCFAAEDTIRLIQTYVDCNKIIEAVLLDNIAFNDVQKHYKKTIKTKNSSGEDYKYVEHSSEFWRYKLVKIITGLSAEYKASFARRYNISDSKLTACLETLHKMNNQKIYKSIDRTLNELRTTYCY